MTPPKKPTGEHIRARTQVTAAGKDRRASQNATKPMPPISGRETVAAARLDERLTVLRDLRVFVSGLATELYPREGVIDRVTHYLDGRIVNLEKMRDDDAK